jgi:hypothetical protein
VVDAYSWGRRDEHATCICVDALGKCDGILFDNGGIGMLPRVEEHRYIY